MVVLPASPMAAGAPMSYDVVFSNSLLEHVGGHAQRAALAREVRSLAPRHWVQTPYRYFPLEPHWLFPGMQFPLEAQAEFWKQMVPDWLNALPTPNPTVPALSDLARRLAAV